MCRFYCFKEDYHFDNDIYDARKLGADLLQWDVKKAIFTIIFKKADEPLSYFYAEEKESGNSFNGSVDNNEPINENISEWMKNNLSNYEK